MSAFMNTGLNNLSPQFVFGFDFDGVLINSAIANAKNPILMAQAFKNAVISGRDSFLAGRMKKNYFATPSSPLDGLI